MNSQTVNSQTVNKMCMFSVHAYLSSNSTCERARALRDQLGYLVRHAIEGPPHRGAQGRVGPLGGRLHRLDPLGDLGKHGERL